MDRAIVLIILIGGIILAAYLTKLVNYYTFGQRMQEKEKNKDLINHRDTEALRKNKLN